MENLLIGVISVITASFSLAMFFMDYKKDRYLLSSIELIIAIMVIACGVCSAWDFTLKCLAIK